MTTRSNDRHRRMSRNEPRSGGRTTGRINAGGKSREQPEEEFQVSGAVALAAKVKPAEAPTETSAQEPRLRVAPPAPVRTPRAPFIMLVLAIVISGVVGILLLNTKINENAFRLHDLQKEQENLDTRQEQLEADIAQQAAPANVAGKAKELGMQQPTSPPVVIVLPDGRKFDMPQPAVGN